jgi:hypothetical protein
LAAGGTAAIAAAGGTAALAAGADAGGESLVFSGNLCSPVHDGMRHISRGVLGVQNPDPPPPASLTVECPIDFTPPAALVSATVTVFDHSAELPVSCTLHGLDSDGSELVLRTVSSEDGKANAQTLRFESPGSLFLTQANMECVIPAASTAGISHISSYEMSFVRNQ